MTQIGLSMTFRKVNLLPGDKILLYLLQIDQGSLMAVMMDGKNFKVTCRPASPGECPAVMEVHCVSAQRGSHGSTWTLSTTCWPHH